MWGAAAIALLALAAAVVAVHIVWAVQWVRAGRPAARARGSWAAPVLLAAGIGCGLMAGWPPLLAGVPVIGLMAWVLSTVLMGAMASSPARQESDGERPSP